MDAFTFLLLFILACLGSGLGIIIAIAWQEHKHPEQPQQPLDTMPNVEPRYIRVGRKTWADEARELAQAEIALRQNHRSAERMATDEWAGGQEYRRRDGA